MLDLGEGLDLGFGTWTSAMGSFALMYPNLVSLIMAFEFWIVRKQRLFSFITSRGLGCRWEYGIKDPILMNHKPLLSQLEFWKLSIWKKKIHFENFFSWDLDLSSLFSKFLTFSMREAFSSIHFFVNLWAWSTLNPKSLSSSSSFNFSLWIS